jgi:Zn-dependent peptidase ImmA (M78 family)
VLFDLPTDDYLAAVDACAADLLWDAGVHKPPVDAAVVARQAGLELIHRDRMAVRGQFVRMAGYERGDVAQGTIVIGHDDRPEREQWAIAHEIGESVAHEVFVRLGVVVAAVSPTSREKVANDMASAILLPRRWFAADGRAFDWDLFEMKDRYATASHELIVRRMLEMRPAIAITICDQGRVTWRRSNRASRLPPLLPEEQAAWKHANATGLPATEWPDPSETALERVRAWPVHEPDWRREIIRSEIAEWTN